MKKTLGLFLMLSALSFARTLNLEEAIDLSLTNSKNVQIAEKNKKIGELNLSRAFKYALPTVAYQGVYTRYEHDTREVYNEKGINDDSFKVPSKDGYSSKIIATYPIFQGGAIFGGIKGAAAQKNILNYSFLKEKVDTRIRVIQYYSNVITYEKNLEALKTSEKELQTRMKLQEKKLEERLIIRADLLKTEYSLLDIQSQIVKVQNQIETEKKNLKIELGLNINEEIDLEELFIPENLSSNIDFEKDLITAKTQSLNALISKNKVEYSKAEKMVALSDNLPKISVFASYGGTERLHSSDTFHDEEWRGGVQIDWELFSFGSGIDAYRVARENYKIEELNDNITQDNIEINLATAYSEVLRLEKYRVAMKSSLEASRENYEIDKKRYEAGLLSTQDYLNSEAQYRTAQMNFNSAESSYLLAFENYRSLII
ncbi:TolC family protein [Fusobacterium perfoetens]|uniref:TolC family protein n=1 Tax=Fusobacterium perfoetens TaxID=852 RepID=UPI00048128C3|nr:TolC family protein [Fusobacterium perfoetens]MCI6152461.1 TolC family protein [Fusobacterium perfoetens]MDY3237723.1 TolC family protein [Fusobacterium perfoetens]